MDVWGERALLPACADCDGLLVMKRVGVVLMVMMTGMGMAQSKLPLLQQLTKEPPAKVDRGLEMGDGLLRGLDGYTTHHVIAAGGYEKDPLMPNTSNRAAIGAAQAGYGMLIVGGSRWLRSKGHPKLARALVVADLVSEGIAVGNNVNVIKGMKR